MNRAAICINQPRKSGWFCLSGFNDGWEKGKGRMWLARRQPLQARAPALPKQLQNAGTVSFWAILSARASAKACPSANSQRTRRVSATQLENSTLCWECNHKTITEADHSITWVMLREDGRARGPWSAKVQSRSNVVVGLHVNLVAHLIHD